MNRETWGSKEAWYKVEMYVIGLEEPPSDPTDFRAWFNSKVTVVDDLVVLPISAVRTPRQVHTDVLRALTEAQRTIDALRGGIDLNCVSRPRFSDRLLMADCVMHAVPELGLFEENDYDMA